MAYGFLNERTNSVRQNAFLLFVPVAVDKCSGRSEFTRGNRIERSHLERYQTFIGSLGRLGKFFGNRSRRKPDCPIDGLLHIHNIAVVAIDPGGIGGLNRHLGG